MVNYRSGDITVTITVKSGAIFQLKTLQSIDPAPVDNIEVIDSLTQQRMGYHFNPRRMRITLVVLPSTYNDSSGNPISDTVILNQLAFALYSNNYLDGIFDLSINDEHDGVTYNFGDSAIATGSIGTITMDAVPATQFTLECLNPEILDKTKPAEFYQPMESGIPLNPDVYAAFPKSTP
jgi:hypothetical protein